MSSSKRRVIARVIAVIPAARAPRGAASSREGPSAERTKTRSAPSSTASAIGAFVDDAAVHQEPAVPSDGREHPGDRGAGEQRVHDRTAPEQHLLAGHHIRGDDAHRDRRILRPREVAMALDPLPQA
jgi:hypothetical protein